MMFGQIIEMVIVITVLIGELKVQQEDLLISLIISHFKILLTPTNPLD
jgi:hypothetical protein